MLLIAFEETRFRAVTHLDLSAEDVERALPLLEEARDESLRADA